jgi:hypothetical protein
MTAPQACTWDALRLGGVDDAIPGCGRLSMREEVVNRAPRKFRFLLTGKNTGKSLLGTIIPPLKAFVISCYFWPDPYIIGELAEPRSG